MFTVSFNIESKELSKCVASKLPKIKDSEFESIRETYPMLRVALRSGEGLKELWTYVEKDITASVLKGDSTCLSTAVFSALLGMGSDLRNEIEG
jgi:hypothetical protein